MGDTTPRSHGKSKPSSKKQALSYGYENSWKREFREFVMEGKWEEVINRYEEDSDYHKINIKGRDTALHVAVNNDNHGVVERLVAAIVEHEGNGPGYGEDHNKSALTLRNERGATPLHLAAYRGFISMCESIVGEFGERKHLIQVENDRGETPIFWAVLARKRKAFAYLRQFFPNDLNIAITNNNDSILHSAIRREMFGLANIILHCYPGLIDLRNDEEVTPLEVLATKTSAFKSGSNLSWWQQILYHCILVNPVNAKAKMELYLKRSKGNKDKDQSQISIQLCPILQTSAALEKEDKVLYTLAPPNYVICLRFLHNIQKFLSRLGMPGVDLTAIKKIKEKHIWGGQLLNSFMEYPFGSYMGNDGFDPLHNEEDDEEIEEEEESLAKFIKQRREQVYSHSQNTTKETTSLKDSAKIDEKETTFLAVAKSGIVEIMEELHSKVPSSSRQSHDIACDKKGLLLVAMKNIESESVEKIDKKETAFLAAAKNGIVEIVSKLQSKIESVVHDTTSEKENVLLVAVKNKQPLVVQQLMKTLKKQQFESLILETDDKDNTVLHLAAGTVRNNEKTWKITGAAMQMMWDIKWYQYIKGLVPTHFPFTSNKDGKTPGEIFKEQHKELLQNSSDWLKDTAESCSVVAALIAGVSFATSSTVPGGTKETGKPTLEGQPAFDAFAISSLVGLYFSVTALIMFLSILTSRKQVEDFRKSLPMKLLFGLSSLFVSIASMLIAFCAGHFFVLTDKYKGVLFPLYVATCLPVTFYAIVQFPLYVDLVKVIIKGVPPPSVKGVHL